MLWANDAAIDYHERLLADLSGVGLYRGIERWRTRGKAGLAGGVGRLIIEYAREATSDPAKVYTAVFGALKIPIGGSDDDAGRARGGAGPNRAMSAVLLR